MQFRDALKHIACHSYRIDQLIEWIYVKKASSFDEFTNIPKELRIKLNDRFLLRTLKIVKKEKSRIDGTIKYTFQTVDKKCFYAVFLPAKNKNSVCISSQVGCHAMCAFCSSWRVKFTRNLTRGEIIEQILQIENDTKSKISGVLFMGMGEPAFNFNNVIVVLNSLLSKKEFAIGKRHITVSSLGIVPAIKRLADSNFNVQLALSVHAVDEKQRKKLIPNNFGFSIKDILDIGEYYLRKTNSRITIEYVLVKGINDSVVNARKLARLLRRHKLLNPNVRVNLIPFNPIVGVQFQPAKQEVILKFKNMLKFNGITVNIRQAKGADINAACGQLGY
jgi:23S rRNA (adenine2503-C2)-methyltransferase